MRLKWTACIWVGMHLHAASESCEGDSNELLQGRVEGHASLNLKSSLPPDRTPEGLKDLASRLLDAKMECLRSTIDCIPALKQVRYRVWPFVKHLIHWPHKSFEPVTIQPQVVKARMICDGLNHTMFLLHIWQTSSMEELEAISSQHSVVQAFEDNLNWCNDLGLFAVPPPQRSAVAVVRDPLERFMAAYGEIEGSARHMEDGLYSFLHQEEEGSVERAKLFMHRFFEDGVAGNEYIKPQSEYLAPFSQNCSLPLDFIVRAERLQSDYHTFLESKRCEKQEVSTSELSEMENSSSPNSKFKEVLNTFVNSALLQASSASSTAMKKVLHKSSFAYLRAFCWMSFADYVIFDYAMPEKCNDQEMLEVLSLVRAAEDAAKAAI